VGTHGSIVLYPDSSATIADPQHVAREVIRAFEQAGLITPGTSRTTQPTGESSVTFELALEDGTLPEHVHFAVDASELSRDIEQLVYVSPEDEGELELPFLDISVFSQAVPLVDPMSGESIGQTTAAIEFSYEDVRLSDEVHRLRDPTHKVLVELAGVFGAPIRTAIVAY
jgi:hypothetical protein